MMRLPVRVRVRAAAATAAVAALVTAAALPHTMPSLTPASAPGDNPCYRYTKAERSFVAKMNRAREANRLRPMKLDPEASKVAKVHTKHMARSNTLEHSTTRQLTRRVTNWQSLGENVGVGGDVRSLHKAFMDSEPHRANVLNRGFTNVGLGTVWSNGRLWVTFVFEARQNPGTTLSMPRC